MAKKTRRTSRWLFGDGRVERKATWSATEIVVKVDVELFYVEYDGWTVLSNYGISESTHLGCQPTMQTRNPYDGRVRGQEDGLSSTGKTRSEALENLKTDIVARLANNVEKDTSMLELELGLDIKVELNVTDEWKDNWDNSFGSEIYSDKTFDENRALRWTAIDGRNRHNVRY